MRLISQSILKVVAIVCFSLVVSSCGLYKSAPGVPFCPETKSSVFPKPVGYVNDFEEILSEAEERELERTIMSHEAKTSDQIAIVTLRTFDPFETLDEYSLNLANYWGVGTKELNNGILIALGKEIRAIRINNGSGIESRITDEETKKIIDELMIPAFRRNDYFEGLKLGLSALIEELN